MRLSERKILVVQGLMDEAEAESMRCETEIENINDELAEDDEKMELVDEERHNLFNEARPSRSHVDLASRRVAQRFSARRRGTSPAPPASREARQFEGRELERKDAACMRLFFARSGEPP